MKKLTLFVTLLSFLVTTIFLMGWHESATARDEPIKIGALLPFTGAALHEGPEVKQGIELALDHYGWQVAGRKIQLIIEDDGTDPPAALDKARKLAEKDRVSIIIGPVHSGVAKAVQPYIMKKKIISLKSRTFPAPLVARFPYLFSSEGTNRQLAMPMGDYAYDVLKYRKVSIMGPDFITGRALLAGFSERFKELGGTVIQEQWFPFRIIDFGPYLANLNQEVDGMVVWAPTAASLRLLKQYGEYGINKKIPMTTAFLAAILSEEILPTIGDIALGICGPTTYASSLDNPLNRKVVPDYIKKYNQKPSDSAIIGGYVNAQLAVEALKVTKGDTNPDKLKEAILNLKIDTPAGPMRFTPERLAIYNVYICKIAKIADEYFWKVVKTYEDVKPR